MKKFNLILILCFIMCILTIKSVLAIEILPPPEINFGENYTITRVRASHILVKTESEAIKIRQEIVNGKSFAKAAQEYSICPSKDDGGDLGFFCSGMMVPEFEKAAFALPVGKLSMPVKSEFGWHLIMVTDK